ncbi:MAG: hypothetical protein AB7F59_03495 [Bdellovibrionales bacterium]
MKKRSTSKQIGTENSEHHGQPKDVERRFNTQPSRADEEDFSRYASGGDYVPLEDEDLNERAPASDKKRFHRTGQPYRSQHN